MMKSPVFRGLRPSSTDFDDVRNRLRTVPLWFDVDLSVGHSIGAGTLLNLNIAGNSFFIDQKQNSGMATVHFFDGDNNSAPITVFPGFIARVPFTQLAIENVAQPGQVMRIIYGVDIEFIPTTGAGLSVTATINVADIVGSATQTVTYIPGGEPVGTTVALLVSPALNVNGVAVRQMYMTSGAGAGGVVNTVLIASKVAPVGLIAAALNTLLLCRLDNAAAALISASNFVMTRRIPPGWGIWHVSVVTVAAATVFDELSIEFL
jgi:hypothetical protein